jgi:hypothetical protein
VVEAGTYEVSLHKAPFSADISYGTASVSVMWIPFDGSGETP